MLKRQLLPLQIAVWQKLPGSKPALINARILATQNAQNCRNPLTLMSRLNYIYAQRWRHHLWSARDRSGMTPWPPK
jgi:hypothetical protein